MRLIRSGASSPAFNLALDEALLRSGEETLRLYAWDPPGLSLGYFQAAADFAVSPGFELVRRPTGGGAIAHCGELTIAWIGARRRVDSVYADINALVTQAVGRLGVRVEPGHGEPEAAPKGLCFDAYTAYDLMVGGRKLFGSAQRRGGDRFLCHGTLVLAPNPLAGGAISLEEALGRPVGRPEAERLVVEAATEIWGAEPSDEPPTQAELAAAAALIKSRYGNQTWTYRR